MAMLMSSLLEEVSRDHFPRPPATPEAIGSFEQRVGWKLDPDLRAFYLHCDGASLIQRPDSPYEILPLSQIIRHGWPSEGRDDSRGPPRCTPSATCAMATTSSWT